eukprot:g63013.t1
MSYHITSRRAAGSSDPCEYERQIANYTGNDPLAPWLKYVAWSRQNCETDEDQAELARLLETCTKKLKNNQRYTNSKDYVKLWIIYADLLPPEQAVHVFNYLSEHGIGQKLAMTWTTWALAMENRGDWKGADKTYMGGLLAQAEPPAIIVEAYAKFKARYEAFQDAQECLKRQHDSAGFDAQGHPKRARVDGEIETSSVAFSPVRSALTSFPKGDVYVAYDASLLIYNGEEVSLEEARMLQRAHRTAAELDAGMALGQSVSPPALSDHDTYSSGRPHSSSMSQSDATSFTEPVGNEHSRDLYEPEPSQKSHAESYNPRHSMGNNRHSIVGLSSFLSGESVPVASDAAYGASSSEVTLHTKAALDEIGSMFQGSPLDGYRPDDRYVRFADEPAQQQQEEQPTHKEHSQTLFNPQSLTAELPAKRAASPVQPPAGAGLVASPPPLFQVYEDLNQSEEEDNNNSAVVHQSPSPPAAASYPQHAIISSQHVQEDDKEEQESVDPFHRPRVDCVGLLKTQDLTAKDASFDLREVCDEKQPNIDLGDGDDNIYLNVESLLSCSRSERGEVLSASLIVQDLDLDMVQELKLGVSTREQIAWEHRVSCELRKRLAPGACKLFLLSEALFLYRDCSCLLVQRFDSQESLQDLMDRYRSFGKSMEQTLVAYYAAEICRLLGSLHKAGFLHCQVSSVAFTMRNSVAEFACDWNRARSGTWEEKGLALGHLDQAVDLRAWPATTRFASPSFTPRCACPAIREGRAWRQDVDCYAAADLIHRLLTGKPLQLRQSRPHLNLPDGYSDVWQTVLSELVSPNCDPEKVQHLLDDFISADESRVKQVKTLLCKQDLMDRV